MRALVLVAAVFVAVSCGDQKEQASVADDAMEGTCGALDQLQQAEPDRAAAEAAFHDAAHGPLHELAGSLGDRSVKGSLLEAKGAIENGEVTEEAFVELVEAILNAADSADLPAPEPCDA